MALGDLGVLCSDLGDLAGARAALERAIASAHPFEAPGAAFNLGVLLRDRGRVEEARAAYQRAVDFGHPKFTIDATLALGQLEMLTGRLEQAVACYVQVITTAAAEQASIAAVRLVSVLRLARVARQPLETADQILVACRRLLDLGAVEAASWVALSLGLADDAVARRRATRAWRLVAQAGHPEYAPLARYRLGGAGRSPAAALRVGRLALRHAEYDLAVAALARAATADHPAASPSAALELGRVLVYSLGQVEDAKAALRLAADTGGPTVTGAALAQLGRLYASYGNRPLAEATWRQGRRHPDPATAAAFRAERKMIGRVTSRYRRRYPRQPSS
jgi:tetratricopeptide (TPR) repeat protein